MTLGERIRAARHASSLSTRELGGKVGVSAQAISKYERNMDVPSSAVLLRLADALNVKVDYFFRKTEVTLSMPRFSKQATIPKKQQRTILGRVQDTLERQLEAESLFPDEQPRFTLSRERRAGSFDQVEKLAEEVRKTWRLGDAPIENAVQLFEDHGVKIQLVEGCDKFDACTSWANDEIPIIAVKTGLPGDRQRFSLAHDLGHLIMKPEGIDEEKAANRFAGALLVPASEARKELGSHRRSLDPLEIHLLKHKYGLSMKGWVHRAEDLQIISRAAATSLYKMFRDNEWDRTEPGDQLQPDEPKRLVHLVLRALMEHIISDARASELLGVPLAEFRRKEEQEHGFPVQAVANG